MPSPRRKSAPSKPENARAAALLTLLDLETNRYPAEALDEYGSEYGAGLNRRDRALARALVFGVLRHRGRLDWILGHFLKKPEKPLDAAVRNILRLGLFQLTLLDRIPASAAVNESVNLAREYGPPGSQNLVNGVLRAVTRAENLPDPEKADLPAIKKMALIESHPEWLVKRWADQLGFEETAELLRANNQIPPLSLRVNSARVSRERLAALLKNRIDLVRPTVYAPEGLLIHGPTGLVMDLPGYDEGYFSVQDEASQLISFLARPGPGERVLDACAGRGGKTLHLLSMNNGDIWALDIDLNRLSMITPEAKRLGLGPVKAVRGDLVAPPFRPEFFQVVLVDAPCSNLGVIRRRPDLKWLKSASEPHRMAAIQIRLLKAAASLVAPRGRLVYAVCTNLPEETRDCVEAFRQENKRFRQVSAKTFLPPSAHPLVETDGSLQTWPHKHQTDAFFAAVFKKIN